MTQHGCVPPCLCYELEGPSRDSATSLKGPPEGWLFLDCNHTSLACDVENWPAPHRRMFELAMPRRLVDNIMPASQRPKHSMDELPLLKCNQGSSMHYVMLSTARKPHSKHPHTCSQTCCNILADASLASFEHAGLRSHQGL
jgi:hypothetical protein